MGWVGMAAAAVAVCAETVATSATVSQDILNLALSLFLHLSFAITGLLISEYNTGNNEPVGLKGEIVFIVSMLCHEDHSIN